MDKNTNVDKMLQIKTLLFWSTAVRQWLKKKKSYTEIPEQEIV